MADSSYEVNAYGAAVKVRSPSIVVLLHVVTLGFYNWYWYYKINRELRDFGKVYRLERLQEVNPWLSLLAVTFGSILIVPAFVSWYRCTKRIQDAQAVLGHSPLSGLALGFSFAGGLLLTLPFLIIPYLVQDALNKVWEPFRGIDPHAGHDPNLAPVSIGALDSLPQARGWDTSRVDAEQMAAITHFLLSRAGLEAGARTQQANDLAARIRPLVVGAEPDLEPERLLELVAATRAEAPADPVAPPATAG